MRALPLAVLALAACAPTAQAPSEALPLARANLDPGAAAVAQGETRFTVRATRGGGSVPAQCRAEGQGFSAAFAAPAELAVPAYGAASAPIRVTCTAGGHSGAQTAAPALRQTGGSGGFIPTVGIGVSSGGDTGVSLGGWWGGLAPYSQATYAVRYPDLAIALDRGAT